MAKYMPTTSALEAAGKVNRYLRDESHRFLAALVVDLVNDPFLCLCGLTAQTPVHAQCEMVYLFYKR